MPMPPSSMSKMMTVYMLFERLRDGSLIMEDTFSISENAWRKGGAKSGGSTMFLIPGRKVRVEDLIRGIIVQSGNDACIVVAEGLASSESAFASEMTARAREIGLTGSIFTNSTGWPHADHYMTARDLAFLTRLIIKEYPEYFPLFAEKSFTYNDIEQSNRNPLLYKDLGADGMKTGYTEEAGFGLTATAKRDGRRLILVLNGQKSARARALEAERVLNWGFRETKNYDLFEAGDEVEQAEVWLGTEPLVPLVIKEDVVVTLNREARKKLTIWVEYDSPVPAPITEGDLIAHLMIEAPDMTSRRISLAAAHDVDQLDLFGRLFSAMDYIVF
ncbi:MAG: D-alanyl-D-alanine carboxypeptidase family protein, partial [Alphaproteobacteria bacterium]|nr:D-alanyl-D-alanine carboxypeptidase family protein [Alphaproteobacteria bacterium]